MLYKVETTEKKSINVRTEFEWNGKTFSMDEWYRWGYVTVATDEKLPDNVDTDPFVASDYDIQDLDFNDGVACSIEQGDLTDEEYERVQEMWDEDGYAAFEEAGIWVIETETYLYGELEITCIDDTPSQEEDQPKINIGWPYS